MRRIMVIGAPGSGKSTLTGQIAKVLDLPACHIDHALHLPGWAERPPGEAQAIISAWVDEARWVIDGNRSDLWPERVRRADLIVYLERPVALRLWRVLGRILRHYGRVRPDMAPQCPERFDPEFLWYIVSTRRSYRAKARRLIANHADRARTIRSDAGARALLQDLARTRNTAP